MTRPSEKQLIDGLADALEGMQEMIDYVSDYFRHKWDLDGYIERAGQLLAEARDE